MVFVHAQTASNTKKNRLRVAYMPASTAIPNCKNAIPQVTEVKIQTYQFPVGLRFQQSITREEEDICLDPLKDRDPVVRRKLQRLSMHFVHEVRSRRAVPGPFPPFLRYNVNDLNPTVELLKHAQVEIQPCGRSKFLIFADDPNANDHNYWPNRLSEGLPPIEVSDDESASDSESSVSNDESMSGSESDMSDDEYTADSGCNMSDSTMV